MDPALYWEEKARTHGHPAATYLDPVLRAFEIPLRRQVFFANVPWRRGIRVLDIGTGIGEWAMEFWRRGADVVGIDISPTMIRMAREIAGRHGAAIHYEVAGVQRVPKECNQRFDMVTSITVLQLLLSDQDLAEGLAQCRVALNAGGLLVCMEFTDTRRFRNKRNDYMAYRTRGQWLEHFQCAGFAPERVIVVPRVPSLIHLYDIYARFRWPTARPPQLTWDGRLWCGLLHTASALLTRTASVWAGRDLTLFVLRRR